MTGAGRTPPPRPARRDAAQAWAEYVSAAQRLDAVRRAAADAAAGHARALQSARDELTAVRARLAPQQARLREMGVPDEQLAPTPAEVAAATAAMPDAPAGLLATLRRARAIADDADAVLIGGGPRGGLLVGWPGRGPAGSPVWLRNSLVYGPFALVVVVVMAMLLIAVDARDALGGSALCALTMPAAAFGLGWVTIGMAFPADPGGRVERTPLIGAAICFAPVFAVCLGAGLLSIVR